MENLLPVRKRMRLPEYDYSQSGCYFLTICTRNKVQLFCRIYGFDADGLPLRTMTPAGQIVERYILGIPAHYPMVTLDHYAVMPNHIHLLVSIETADDAQRPSRPNELVPRMISALKRLTNREAGAQLWQDGYEDHVIRNDQDYAIHWSYIEHNPFRWAEDKYYDPQ